MLTLCASSLSLLLFSVWLLFWGFVVCYVFVIGVVFNVPYSLLLVQF